MKKYFFFFPIAIIYGCGTNKQDAAISGDFPLVQGRESIGAIFHNGGIKKAGISFSAGWFYGNTDFVEEDGLFFFLRKKTVL